MKRTRFAISAALALCLGWAGVTQAGIVILKSGKVFVGKISPEDITEAGVRIRWSKKDLQQGRGEMFFKHEEIRWSDAEADMPTDAYWQQYANHDLAGARWEQLRQDWLRKSSAAPDPLWPVDMPLPRISPLDATPISHPDFSVRKPFGWSANIEDGILILRGSPQEGRSYTPRIHLFAVKTAKAAYEDQVQWIRKELVRLAKGNPFEIDETYRLRQVPGGADQRLLTETALPEHKVKALRRVSFRGERTFFFAAYAAPEDFEKLSAVFEASLKSLNLTQ